jgi:chromosome segregation ATPase
VNLSNKRLNDSFKKSIELESKVRSLQKDLFNNASKLKQAESHIEFERLKLASVESQLNDQTSLTDFFKDQLTIKQAQIDQFIKM